MAKKDYYKILNVDPKATQKAIKSAYRQMALKYHPDHNPGNKEALKQFNLVREAYDTLTDPNLKKQYDFEYSPSVEPEVTRKPDRSSPKKNNKNLRYNLYITLEDVATGAERTIRYIRKNKNEKETVQLKVKIPKGAFHQQRLRLAQYGDTDGSVAGDLFVIIHLQNHPIFIRNGLNLRLNVPITYVDAALGNSIEIPTLTGTRKIKLKSCQFENINFNLKGFGLPDSKHNYKGDLDIHFFIEHPTRLNTADRDALQKAARTWPQGEMMQQYQSYLRQTKRR